VLTHSRPPSDDVGLVVLGARGFVARALTTHASAQGWRVRALGSDELDLTSAASVDVLAGLLTPADVLVFVSALTPDRGKDIATLMRNLTMGQHVCAALENQTCAHVVNIGSDAVYDDRANPVRETSPEGSGSFHGVMHFTREQMLIDTCRRRGIPLARLRPSLLFGPGDTHNGYGPNRFVRTAAAERRIALFGGGEERRDHVFIEDVARLTGEVVRRRSTGVLNIATGESHSFREVADLVAARVPGVTIEPSARANPITHRHFDVTALITAFPGFRFVPLAEGLARMVESIA